MGTQLLTRFQMGKETTKGTAVAATRRYAPSMDSMFSVDFMNNYGENRMVGRRNPISDAVSMGTMVTINYQTGDEGIAYNELQTFTQFPDGGTATGSGTATWAHSYGGTAAGTFVTYTMEYADNVQEYEAEYGFCTNWTVSADVGGMTQLAATLVGRQSTKSTVTSLDYSPSTRIPSYLWQWKYASAQSGLSGASSVAGQLKSFSLNVAQTGLTPGKYLDGAAYFTSANETLPFQATLDLVVVHTSATVSEIYDKAAAQTVSFIDLKALTSAQYSADFQMAVIYENPTLLESVDGETCIGVTARLVYDDTWGKSLLCTTINNRNTFI